MDLFNKIKKIKSDYDAALKPLEQELKTLLLGIVESYPDLRAISWTQYTPGFNDGDPCYFRMGEIYVSFVGLNESDSKDDEAFATRTAEVFDTDCGYDTEDYISELNETLYFYGTWGMKNTKAAKDIGDLASNLYRASELLERAFGDGVRVTVLNTGKVVVDDYECGY